MFHTLEYYLNGLRRWQQEAIGVVVENINFRTMPNFIPILEHDRLPDLHDSDMRLKTALFGIEMHHTCRFTKVRMNRRLPCIPHEIERDNNIRDTT
ncbi:MAG TPA: hypothetical protein VL096_12085, partial [Pirellulaceae bacterium]|nr:hypothetical protein [Pirellulaceae bacterium]